MTTEKDYTRVDNIARPNDVLSLPLSSALFMSAVLWRVPAANRIAQARLACLKRAVEALTARRPSWELWLVAGHKPYQPNNRVVRYRRLWKSLSSSGIVLPQGHYLEESIHEFAEGIRAFGAMRFEPGQVERVHAVMSASQAAIVFLPNGSAQTAVSELVRRGWAVANTKPPEEMIEAVSQQSGLVIDVYGEFDDPEVVTAAIGTKEVLDAVCI